MSFVRVYLLPVQRTKFRCKWQPQAVTLSHGSDVMSRTWCRRGFLNDNVTTVGGECTPVDCVSALCLCVLTMLAGGENGCSGVTWVYKPGKVFVRVELNVVPALSLH